MNNNDNYLYLINIIKTALRDIVDVLYDGCCTEIPEEELLPTIYKKIFELQYKSKRERKYKLLKIISILKSFQQSKDSNINVKVNEELVLFKFKSIICLCEDLLKINLKNNTKL